MLTWLLFCLKSPSTLFLKAHLSLHSSLPEESGLGLHCTCSEDLVQQKGHITSSRNQDVNVSLKGQLFNTLQRITWVNFFGTLKCQVAHVGHGHHRHCVHVIRPCPSLSVVQSCFGFSHFGSSFLPQQWVLLQEKGGVFF